MPHNIDLILTLTSGLTAALLLGMLTQKLKLSPIVGYLLAGVFVGPFTPGYVANHDIAQQCAEIGVILLMFGVGLHFHLKDLLAVRAIAIPGAVVQIVMATVLGAVVCKMLGWSWTAGVVFGMAISVASTVVLTRVLADNRALHTPIGHIAVGWLIVEDLFTIIVLVLLPAFFTNGGQSVSGSGPWISLGIALLKLVTLVVFALLAGRKLIPWCLGYVARSGSRELFTLAVLVLALGIAVGSAKWFGASMALGAFLAGMIVGQSTFSARAAAEALPMRDAFAVLFFVSVGMLLDPFSLMSDWPIVLATLGVVLIGKPLAALAVVLVLKKPLRAALAIAVALSQIGEFSFILATLASGLGILPKQAYNALVVASIVSITLNPLLYQMIAPVMRLLEKFHLSPPAVEVPEARELVAKHDPSRHVIVIGYGPVGRTLTRILRENSIDVVIIEMNIETVERLTQEGVNAVYGDAAQREILQHAFVEKAESLIIAASGLETEAVVQTARELNPDIRILTRATYLKESGELRKIGANAVFSSEGEIALAMLDYLMRQLGATEEQIDREHDRLRRELF
ncbi:MAG: sodium:proton exchanger [Verrucomicrobia bacterium Tous-C9LFEB]|nr:MAG: sodium:proton exchanger [Verrucomicrobia bacterium Tous-C9LFEB]